MAWNTLFYGEFISDDRCMVSEWISKGKDENKSSEILDGNAQNWMLKKTHFAYTCEQIEITKKIPESRGGGLPEKAFPHLTSFFLTVRMKINFEVWEDKY